MQIVDKVISRAELVEIAQIGFGDMVKGVVDVGHSLVAIDAELHADLETYLLEQGSRQEDLWGINLYPDEEGEDFIEFDSLINIRPLQNNRGRGVYDPAIREKIRDQEATGSNPVTPTKVPEIFGFQELFCAICVGVCAADPSLTQTGEICGHNAIKLR